MWFGGGRRRSGEAGIDATWEVDATGAVQRSIATMASWEQSSGILRALVSL